jgi:hypothetical protein
VKELRPGLWTWSGPHPDWSAESDGGPGGWEHEVRSYAHGARDALVLFDPLVEPDAIARLARGRPVVVLLTCDWHSRSTQRLVQELGAVVHAPGTEDVGLAVVPYAAGDRLPGDVVAQQGGSAEEFPLWIPEHGALVSGDLLLGGERGYRVQPDSWLGEGLTHESLREVLRPLLDLPLELLLPTHGEPVVEDAPGALRAALDT